MQSLRRLCLWIAILAVLSMIWSTRVSDAALFYVATTGDDANPGTVDSPFRTMQRGARALSAGDTLIVQGGTYPEVLLDVIPSGTSWSEPVTVQAAPGETVVIQAPYDVDGVIAFVGADTHYIIVDGFVIDANYLGLFAFATDAGANYIRVINCEIKHSRASGMLMGGEGHEIINVDVHDNGSSGYDHGLYLTGSQTRVEHSRFYSHVGYGIQLYGGEDSDNVLDSNLTYDNSSGGMWVGGVRNTIANNTIWGNGHGLILAAPDSLVYNNTISNNYGIPGDEGLGIILLDSDWNVEIINNVVYGNSEGDIYGVTYAIVRGNSFGELF